MRWSLLRSLLSIGGAAIVAGCSLLVSVDGLSGDVVTPASRDDAAAEASASGDARSPSDATTADAANVSTYIAVLGGAPDDVPSLEKTVWISRIAADGSLEPWSTTTPLVEPRSRAGIVWTGSALALVGGLGPVVNTGTPYLGILDGASVTQWKPASSEPATSYARLTAVAHAGRVYAMCGYDNGTEQSRVVSAPLLAGDTLGTWETTASTPLPCASATAVASGDHVYLVVGGRNTPTTSVGWVADFAASGAITGWRQLPELPGTRSAGAAAVAASDTHVYASGGYTNGVYEWVSTAAILPDGMLGSWSDVSFLPEGRAGMSLVVARGRLYAIGGTVDGVAPDRVRAQVEVADILSDGTLSAWRATTPLPAPRQFHMAAAFTGR